MLDSRYAWPCVRGHTSISIIGEVAAPFNVGASLQVAGSDGVASDRTDNSGIRQLGLSRYDAVGNVVVDGLRVRMKLAIAREPFPVHLLTLCSSCLTSKTVPSLKVQRATSASLLTPLTRSDDLRAVQKLANSWSLMWCQTLASGARMTLLSRTEVEVGIAVFEAMVSENSRNNLNGRVEDCSIDGTTARFLLMVNDGTCSPW